MSIAVFQEVRPNAADLDQISLPLATEGIQRYVWDSKFGSMLIEVVGSKILVNGKQVEREIP